MKHMRFNDVRECNFPAIKMTHLSANFSSGDVLSGVLLPAFMAMPQAGAVLVPACDSGIDLLANVVILILIRRRSVLDGLLPGSEVAAPERAAAVAAAV